MTEWLHKRTGTRGVLFSGSQPENTNKPTPQTIRGQRANTFMQESAEINDFVRQEIAKGNTKFVGKGSFTIVSSVQLANSHMAVIRQVRLWNGSYRGLNPNQVQDVTSFSEFVNEICVCIDSPTTPHIYGAWVDGPRKGGIGYMVVEFCRDIYENTYRRPIAAFMQKFGGDMHTINNIGIGKDGRIVMRDTGQQSVAESFIKGENDYNINKIVGKEEGKLRTQEWRSKGFCTPSRPNNRVTNNRKCNTL